MRDDTSTAAGRVPLQLGRRLAVVGLVGGPLLNTVEAVIGRQLAGGGGDMGDGAVVLAAVEETPGLIAASSLAGLLAAPLILAMGMAIAVLVRAKAPGLSKVTATLAAVGAFGYTEAEGMMAAGHQLVRLADRAEAASLYTELMSESVPLMVLLGAFLVGMFGLVVAIAIGIWRTSIAPRWAFVSLLVFLIMDFAYGPVGPVEPHWFFVAAILPIAAKAHRMSDAQWASETSPQGARRGTGVT